MDKVEIVPETREVRKALVADLPQLLQKQKDPSGSGQGGKDLGLNLRLLWPLTLPKSLKEEAQYKNQVQHEGNELEAQEVGKVYVPEFSQKVIHQG